MVIFLLFQMTIQCQFDLQFPDGETRRANRLAKWSEQKFGLTAVVPDNFDQVQPSVHPSSIKLSASDDIIDGTQLLKCCQVHTCSGYCMRPVANSNW